LVRFNFSSNLSKEVFLYLWLFCYVTAKISEKTLETSPTCHQRLQSGIKVNWSTLEMSGVLHKMTA